MRTLETHVLPGHNRVLSTRHTAPAAGCLNISCLKISHFADRWRALSGRAFFFLSHLEALDLAKAAGQAADRLGDLAAGQHAAARVPAGPLHLQEPVRGYGTICLISVTSC